MKIRGKHGVLGRHAPRKIKEIRMYISPMSRPSWDAQPAVFVREAVRRPMMKIALEIEGLIDIEPHRRMPGAEGALLLQEAGLLIMGTSQFRPLGWDLAEDLSARHGLDILLLRFDAFQVSFDVRLSSRNEWLTHYRRWSVDGELWFTPMEDDGSAYIKASRYGLLLLDHPPYANAIQREVGLAPAGAAVAGQGSRV